MKKKRLGYILLVMIGIIAIIGLGLSSPIEQNEDYHSFSDTLTICGIQNFWNVISNLPFIIVGLFGIFRLKKMGKVNLQFLTFFIGVSLVGLGSFYYHFDPNSNTLVWDRLPMTISFTSLMSIVISEFVDYKKGKLLLLPFILIGIISIIYWVKLGDLRLYVFVQFYPIFAIPVVLLFFKLERNSPIGFWFLIGAYIIAKIFEIYDFEIHNKLRLLSGHSLKHITASIGIYLLIIFYIRQNKISEKQKASTTNNHVR